MTHEQLLAQYTTWENVPNAELYALLQEYRPEMTKLHDLDVARAVASQEKGTKKRPFDFSHFTLPKKQVGQEVRRRCEQDLEWLGGFVCWETNPEGQGKDISENLMTRENHGPLIDFFVKKDKTKLLRDQDITKNRLVLYPRGGMKSSWDIVDAVQWILNFPEIRILFLTAADDLAVGLLTELKAHFVIRESEPTLMNLFFPEFCLNEDEMGNQFEFTCPVWERRQQKRKEPTAMASSIASTLAGYHFESIKADDSVSNKNSENEEQCLKIAKNFSVNKKMLRPFGYCDKIGTRYHDEDMYGQDLLKNAGDLEVVNGPGWEQVRNKTTSTLTLIGRAITIKPEIIEKFDKLGTRATYADAGEDGCILLMPKVLPYDFLVAEHAKDDVTFEGQMNQNPRPPSQVVFDRPMLLKATVAPPDVPPYGVRAQFWDFAYGKKINADYSVGVSAVWGPNGTCYLQDMRRDRYLPQKLAKTVVDFAREYRPFVVGIEDANGAGFLKDTILHEAAKTGDKDVMALMARIDWVTPERNKDAKKIRMSALSSPITDGYLKFASYLPHLKTLYDEFERCLTSGRHDDIPDAIARLLRYGPRAFNVLADPNPEVQKAIKEAFIANAWHNLIFEEDTDPWGRPGGFVPTIAPTDLVEQEGNDRYHPDLDNMLGSGLNG